MLGTIAAVITLAHQGGWDEFLYFVVPVAVGLWALRRAEKRARARAAAVEAEETNQPAQDDPIGKP